MELKDQQAVIATILQKTSLLSSTTPMTRELSTRILKASGIYEKMMRKWHIQFEESSPDEHRAFLGFLQISDEEIKTIRSWTSWWNKISEALYA